MFSNSNISHSQQINKHTGQRNKNQLAFGITLLIFQIVLSILYGLFENPSMSYINISSIIFAIFLAVFVIVGFGLYLSYINKLIWTSIGYSLMIVAFTIQLYPLVNAFWTKISIFSNQLLKDSFSNRGFSLYLNNFDSFQATGNTITGAIKCALAIIIGFSGIIGRSGPLQVLIFTIITTATYQLNRQLAAKLGIDNFGSFTIFGFGGFLSFGCGLIYSFRQKRYHTIKNDLENNKAPVSLSIVGVLFIFLICPILAFQGDNSTKKETFTFLTSALCIIFSMCASLTTNVSICLLIKGQLILRDVQNGLLAGIVVGGTASYYVTNISFALICGFSAGILHPLLYSLIEKRLYQTLGVFCTYAPGVFALQSILSAIFTSIYYSRVKNGQTNQFIYSNTDILTGAPFAICFASAGMGFISGIIAGLTALCLHSHQTFKKFDDKHYWTTDNQISYTVPQSNIIDLPTMPSIGQQDGDFDDPMLWRDIL